MVGSCSPRELEAVAFLDLLLEGQNVVHKAVMEGIKENFLEPAEVLLEGQQFKKIIDVDALFTAPEPMR